MRWQWETERLEQDKPGHKLQTEQQERVNEEKKKGWQDEQTGPREIKLLFS